MHPKNFCYFNGQMLPFEKAQIALNDLGLLRGYAVFDYLRTYQYKPFAVAEHFTRLQKSANAIKIPFLMTLSETEEIIEELLYWRFEKSEEAGVRLLLTGGFSENGSKASTPNFAILTENFSPPSSVQYGEGVKLLLHHYRREMPTIKTTNYLQMYLRQEEMLAKEATDLLYHFEGKISECTRNNFFIIKDKKLITSNQDILEGITRQFIIDLAQQELEVEIRPILLEELSQAEEAFKSGTSNEITPITRIDNQLIGNGKPGKITKNLHQKFKEFAILTAMVKTQTEI